MQELIRQYPFVSHSDWTLDLGTAFRCGLHLKGNRTITPDAFNFPAPPLPPTQPAEIIRTHHPPSLFLQDYALAIHISCPFPS